MKRRTSQQVIKGTLSWINKGLVWTAYPYEIVDRVRGWEIWAHGRHGYENLAREIESKKEAMAFCERHRQKQKETA
jgi:hypothetical protein